MSFVLLNLIFFQGMQNYSGSRLKAKNANEIKNDAHTFQHTQYCLNLQQFTGMTHDQTIWLLCLVPLKVSSSCSLNEFFIAKIDSGLLIRKLNLN